VHGAADKEQKNSSGFQGIQSVGCTARHRQGTENSLAFQGIQSVGCTERQTRKRKTLQVSKECRAQGARRGQGAGKLLRIPRNPERRVHGAAQTRNRELFSFPRNPERRVHGAAQIRNRKTLQVSKESRAVCS
jgi:hypothetical protein